MSQCQRLKLRLCVLIFIEITELSSNSSNQILDHWVIEHEGRGALAALTTMNFMYFDDQGDMSLREGRSNGRFDGLDLEGQNF